MALDSVAASKFPISVSTDAGTTWTPIGGLNQIGFSPAVKTAANGTFGNEGWAADLPVSRSLSIDLAGLAQYDTTTHEKDAGQVAVETLATQIGPDSAGLFRVDTPDPATSYKFTAYVGECNSYGGGQNEALAPWTAKLQVKSKPVVIARPA